MAKFNAMDSSAMENKLFREAHIKSLKNDLKIFCAFSIIFGSSLTYMLCVPATDSSGWIPVITSALVVLYGMTAIFQRLNWFK